MNRLLSLSLALCLPGAAVAQDPCASADWRTAGMARWSSAVMEPPMLGATELLEGAQPAARNLILARQSVTVAPRVRYLAGPVALLDAEGEDLARGVPLGRGAPVTAWRDRQGVKHCAIGWRNGLFGGVTGDGHMRWVCLEDRDGDGAFDNAWRPHSRNLGLSFRRLDIPVSPPVEALAAPPQGPAVASDERTTVQSLVLERQIVVSRINAERILIDSRIDRDGNRRRIERRELPLDAPGEVTLSGITVSVVPTGRGAATVSARGGFAADDIRLQCDGSRIVIGEFAMMTTFTFPDW